MSCYKKEPEAEDEKWLKEGLSLLTQLVINDLGGYMEKAQKAIPLEQARAKAKFVEPNFKALTEQACGISGMFKHADHIKERLNLIKLVAHITG